jgi:hypothetical protein
MPISIMPIFLAGIAFVVVLAFASMGARALHVIVFQKRVKAQRASENYDDFQKSFPNGSASAPILHNVYKVLSEEIAMVPVMPVREADSLQRIYGIDGFSGTNMNDLIEMLSDRCGIDVNDLEPLYSLYTVGDLVRHLNAAMEAGGRREFRRPTSLNETTRRELVLSV